MTVRDWLGRNGHEATLALINEVIAEFAAAGSKERRNWADVLAGGVNGAPFTVAGRAFPVLRAAQLNRRTRVTPNAIWSDREIEPFPAIRRTGRWPKRNRRLQERKATKQPARKAEGSRAKPN